MAVSPVLQPEDTTARDLLHCGISSGLMVAMGLACVKTHTSAKCRKHNSPARHRTSRAQYDLTPRDAICSEIFLRVARPLTFSHGQGLHCVKTPALAADVETFWRNCISESRRYCTPLGSMP